MSFREKSAWVTLVTLIVLTIAFLLHLPMPWTLGPRPTPFLFLVFVISVGTFIAIEIVAHIVMVIRSPRDARTPKDEREHLIELRSRSIAFYVFAVLSLGSTFVAIHIVGTNTFGIAYLLFFSFVAAEIVNYTMRVYYYRRGF